MIKNVELGNYGPIGELKWSDLSGINLLIGKNSSGKTIALKAIFSALKSLSETNKGDDNKSFSSNLSDNMLWTFQPDKSKIGEIVKKGQPDALRFRLTDDIGTVAYQFGRDTEKVVRENDMTFELPVANNVVYIPSKEIVSRYQIILKSRENDKVFGFDETEYSLVKSMQYPVQNGYDNHSFKSAVDELEKFDGGKLEYDMTSERWIFRRGSSQFSLGMLSEGVRKMAVIEKLLSNNCIRPGTVVLIDEIESSLHPGALSKFIEIIFNLAENGVQFFISTHSYIAIKKFYLMARKKEMSLPTASLTEYGVDYSDLLLNMPDNEIIDEAVKIYKEEISLSMGE